MTTISRPMHFPNLIWLGEKAYYFEMVAPITGDGIYRRGSQTGEYELALLVNPHAEEEQARWARRRI